MTRDTNEPPPSPATRRGGWRRKVIGALAGMLVLLAVAAGAVRLGALSGFAPDDLGVRDGRLKPPSKTPNSVSSQASLYPDHPRLAYARIDPIRFTGNGQAAMLRLRGIVAGMERSRTTVDEPGYLRAEFESRLMRYTDDLELWLDEPAGVIHVRSASRIGHGDRGVNRARVEAIRRAFSG